MEEYLYWLLIAIICFIIEIFSFTTFFLFIGIATLIMSILLYFIPNMDIMLQAVIFLILSLLVVIAFYKFGKKLKIKKVGHLDVNDRMSIYVGRVVEALSDSENGIVKVQLGDTVWRAKANDIRKGSKLKITGFESTTFICEKV